MTVKAGVIVSREKQSLDLFVMIAIISRYISKYFGAILDMTNLIISNY